MDTQLDVLIVGGGVGGCAAALAVAEAGLRVALTEETEWIGGQLTSQGVPPDEHGWIERFGCTASYRKFREGVREHYRRNYPLTERARADARLNPGNGWVSPLCHEPRVALAVLEGMLSPHVAAERLTVLRRHRALAADVEGDSVRAVRLRDERTGRERTVEARWVVDATELGDLLPLTGTEHVTGAEARRETGEPSAPEVAKPGNVQAFSHCFAMDHREGENHVGERPARYGYWREYVPKLTPPWPGKLLSWTTPHPRTMQPNHYRFAPHREDGKAFSGLWSYRRILDRTNFRAGVFASDVCVVNWPLIDYLDGELCTAGEGERARFLAEAREMSRCVFHWMQTEAPRADGGQGWPGLRLRGDLLGSEDGLALAPYIRESRRIRALHTVTEQEVSADHRPGQTLAASHVDSVGIGHYRIDLHPSTGGDNYIDVPALPFQIPLRSLVPVRMRNLLPACKNIGTTHITNGCYRLHPVEWNIGEAVGTLVAYCAAHHVPPAAVAGAKERAGELRRALAARGVEMAWPAGLVLEEGDAHRHAR